jgi:hypothetical protein
LGGGYFKAAWEMLLLLLFMKFKLRREEEAERMGKEK